MSIRTNLRPVMAALAAAAALVGGTAAWATPLPPMQTQGSVSYGRSANPPGKRACRGVKLKRRSDPCNRLTLA